MNEIISSIRDSAGLYILASIISIAIAWMLWHDGHEDEAIAFIVASPFPCPTGLPC